MSCVATLSGARGAHCWGQVGAGVPMRDGAAVPPPVARSPAASDSKGSRSSKCRTSTLPSGGAGGSAEGPGKACLGGSALLAALRGSIGGRPHVAPQSKTRDTCRPLLSVNLQVLRCLVLEVSSAKTFALDGGWQRSAQAWLPPAAAKNTTHASAMASRKQLCKSAPLPLATAKDTSQVCICRGAKEAAVQRCPKPCFRFARVSLRSAWAPAVICGDISGL